MGYKYCNSNNVLLVRFVAQAAELHAIPFHPLNSGILQDEEGKKISKGVSIVALSQDEDFF